MISESDDPRCGKCGQMIDNCQCVCPYCGETSLCECCVGPDVTTGG